MAKLQLSDGTRRRNADGHVCNPAQDPEVQAAQESGSLRDGSLYTCDCGKRYRYNAPRVASWTVHRVVKRKPKDGAVPATTARTRK